jgi:hypothetical protein
MAMNKVLVEVYVPVEQKTYDLFVPVHITLYETLQMIVKIVTEMSGGLFVPNEETTLCSRTDGSILNVNLTIHELGLQNASKLMLV